MRKMGPRSQLTLAVITVFNLLYIGAYVWHRTRYPDQIWTYYLNAVCGMVVVDFLIMKWLFDYEE